MGSAIIGMAVGKYYSQTKLATLQRIRERPQVDYLNEDNQAMVSWAVSHTRTPSSLPELVTPPPLLKLVTPSLCPPLLELVTPSVCYVDTEQERPEGSSQVAAGVQANVSV